MSIEIIDFGESEYKIILDLQRDLFTRLVEAKRRKKKEKEFILIGSHYPVVTMGRRAQEANLLLSRDRLSEMGIEVHNIERGGDVTYHYPGQAVLYPIIDLESHGLGVKDYVGILEESVITLLSEHGIIGERIEGATGVWIGKGSREERKISAIGVKCSRFCTMHGLSLNVDDDLEGFKLINPCGYKDKGVTSIERETGHKIELGIIKKRLAEIFQDLIAKHPAK
ncbi:MAG: lipoyl(octanoyl) transferase LipB [Muribaculaceae bacterium]|nr:lipoyl(octanoyl) transferase LipB [Muribaculaceae bacterium]